MTTNARPHVAYFCMEWALREDLPLYAGGLGVLAGDVLKAAADGGLPLVGVGIVWQEGYVRQSVGPDNRPFDRHEPVPRDLLESLDVTVSVEVRGKAVALRAFRLTSPAHAPLYLLEPRDEEDRWITRRLYQGGYGDRVAQEIVLGAGGVRLLRALGLHVDVFHLNEGHAVLVALELAREQIVAGMSRAEAIDAVRRQVVFTTHTPVMAGNEAHDVSHLMEVGAGLGSFTHGDLAELAGDPFSMTEAGLRLSRVANAVAQLHAGTARHMWAHVRDASPIAAITNGVHVPTWQDARLRTALEAGNPWGAHQQLKGELIAAIAERSGARFEEQRLLIGFARRATSYKRVGLLFHDLPTVAPLLEAGRLQLVFAGKAYPDDAEGRGLIEHLLGMARRFPRGVAFVPDYDLALGRLLTRGCDVWLNTPRRPLEASGTSGMKAALNGVLNVSVLDGWWAEGCEHGVNGWQFGDGYEGPGQDEHDLAALQRVLHDEVLPTYYGDRPRWTAMMRAAVASAQSRFSAERMLREYEEQLYRA